MARITPPASGGTGTSVHFPDGTTAATTVDRPSGWFDIRDYGAMVDGSTDDTAAVQAAIDAAVAAGGGTIYFPRGITQLSAAPTTATVSAASYTYAGQLLLPARTLAQGYMALRFLGETPPKTVFWGPQTGDAVPVEAGGSILRTTATSGNVLDVIPPTTGGALGVFFSNLSFTAENLIIRAPNNPQCGGLKLVRAISASVQNCTIGVNATTASVSQPTGSGVGIYLPGVTNGAFVEVRSSQVYGWPVGLAHSEHAVLDNFSAYACAVAIRPETGYHLAKYSRVLLQRNIKHIAPSGTANIAGDVAFESGTSAWYATQYDIDDGNGQLAGDIAFTRYSAAGLAARGAQGLNLRNLRLLASGCRPSLMPVATADTFANRDDSSYALGQLDSGQTWVATLGTFGIATNKARLMNAGSTTDAVAVVQTLHPTLSLTNYTVTCDVTLSATAALAGIAIHQLGTTYMTVQFRKYGANNVLRLEKRAAAVYTTLADAMSGSLANSTTYTLAVNVTPTTITVSVNGVTQITYTKSAGEQTAYNGLTRCGISAYGSGGEDGGSRWDNFSVA